MSTLEQMFQNRYGEKLEALKQREASAQARIERNIANFLAKNVLSELEIAEALEVPLDLVMAVKEKLATDADKKEPSK